MEDFVWPDRPSRCTYSANGTSPHHHVTKPARTKICSSALDLIGRTPLVRMDRLARRYGLKCELVAKCEFMNPCGSTKDRIAVRMIEEAEREGKLKPGSTVIEATSGNTGIGIAFVCALKGYPCKIIMPEKNKGEKEAVMRALGAEIITTPPVKVFNDPKSHLSVAQIEKKKTPNSFQPDQYTNAYNPVAHYDTTGTEILQDCDNKVDMLVVGTGTGGTMTGTCRKVKEVCPKCKIVGADPVGSILAVPKTLNVGGYHEYLIEGMGYDFVPTTLDRDAIESWVKADDKSAFNMAREIIKYEGLLCGGSSGANTFAAIKACKQFGLGEGDRCVVVLVDSIRNYLTKFVSDEYMKKHNLFDSDWNKEILPK